MAKDLTWTTEELKTWIEQKEWTWIDSTVDDTSNKLMKDLDDNWAKHILPELTKTWEINEKDKFYMATLWDKKGYIPVEIKDGESADNYLVEADEIWPLEEDENWWYFTYRNGTETDKKYIKPDNNPNYKN